MQTLYNAIFGKKKNVDDKASASTTDLGSPSGYSSSTTVQSTTLQSVNKEDWDLVKQQISDANYKELKLLGREGFPDALRPWIWAKITKVESLPAT